MVFSKDQCENEGVYVFVFTTAQILELIWFALKRGMCKV